MSDLDPTKPETAEIVSVPRRELPRIYGPLEPEDLDQRIARSEKMADALDRMRSLAIKRTVPGDWRRFGDTYYLEGDGATRIAPVIGLEMTNVRTSRELLDGITRVTVTADFYSSIFQTSFPNVQRTRATDDEFLSQKGDIEPDLGDLENAAYKGCLARGAQLVAGLAGLSAEDLWTRFGVKVDAGEVKFQKGAATAMREGARDPAAEGDRILTKLCEGDGEAAASMLFKMTDNPTRGYTGSKTAKEVRGGAWTWLLPKLQDMEKKYDAAQSAALGPEPQAPKTNGAKK